MRHNSFDMDNREYVFNAATITLYCDIWKGRSVDELSRSEYKSIVKDTDNTQYSFWLDLRDTEKSDIIRSVKTNHQVVRVKVLARPLTIATFDEDNDRVLWERLDGKKYTVCLTEDM